MEQNIRDLYAQILEPQGIELVSVTDVSTAEPNPQNFSEEVTQRTSAMFRKGDNELTETFYSSDTDSITKVLKQVQLEFALKS